MLITVNPLTCENPPFKHNIVVYGNALLVSYHEAWTSRTLCLKSSHENEAALVNKLWRENRKTGVVFVEHEERWPCNIVLHKTTPLRNFS